MQLVTLILIPNFGEPGPGKENIISTVPRQELAWLWKNKQIHFMVKVQLSEAPVKKG